MKTADLDFTVEYAYNKRAGWEYRTYDTGKVKVLETGYDRYGRKVAYTRPTHVKVEFVGRTRWNSTEPLVEFVTPQTIRETWAQHEERLVKHAEAEERNRLVREKERERDLIEIRDARPVSVLPNSTEHRGVYRGEEFTLRVNTNSWSSHSLNITREEAHALLDSLQEALND